MPDPRELPFLIKLLDDESAEIRQEILDRLESFGDALPAALEKLAEPVDPRILRLVQPILDKHRDRATASHVQRKFFPGQLVKHRRYGYRGVIVGFDLSCQADEAWYHANNTQPDRSQPWYHVLVDGSTQVTYAAESSLEPDAARKPIRHPMLDMFFSAFEGDHYQRNDHPWPFS